MTKIFVNPGHGGKDPGAVGNGLQEKVIVLKIAKKIVEILQDYDVQLKLFRNNDTFYSLNQISKAANDWNADFFISIHVNAGGGTGYEDYIYNRLADNSQTAKYRNVIHAEIMKQIPEVRNRGKKKANFHVLRETRMPAMLTENLFIDNRTDASRLKSEQFINKLALGHANGLIKAFTLKKKQVNKAQPQEQGELFYRVIAGSYKNRSNAEQQVNRLKSLGVDAFIEPFHKN